MAVSALALTSAVIIYKLNKSAKLQKDNAKRQDEYVEMISDFSNENFCLEFKFDRHLQIRVSYHQICHNSLFAGNDREMIVMLVSPQLLTSQDFSLTVNFSRVARSIRLTCIVSFFQAVLILISTLPLRWYQIDDRITGRIYSSVSYLY